MKEEIICAGFGGQGIMLLGKVIAQAAVLENKQVTWFPSYGAAVRGGCAFSMVVISDRKIASPYVQECDTLFVFNQPSWDRFKKQVRKKGSVFFNSTLIKGNSRQHNFTIHKVAFTKIASDLGNVRVANMVALGAYLKHKKILQQQTVLRVFSQIVPADKRHLLKINQQALAKGYQQR